MFNVVIGNHVGEEFGVAFVAPTVGIASSVPSGACIDSNVGTGKVTSIA